MRILHVLDHSLPLHSGYTFRTQAILREQERLGWRPVPLTSAKHHQALLAKGAAPPAPVEELEGRRYHRTLWAPPPWARLPALDQWEVVRGLTRRIVEVARRERVQLLHAHSPALNGLAALRAGRRLGLPVVYEVRAFWEDAAVDHGSCREGDLRYRLTRALETRVLRRARAVTCICEGLRGDILARGLDPARVTVVPNAVDPERFQTGRAPDPALQRALGLEGRRVLAFIGSFYAYEGVGLLLEALPQVLGAHPELRLLLVGGGPEEGRLRERAQALGLGDRVFFAGRVPHEQVQRYYDLAEVLVYPRLPMRLTELVTPLKPLEAMAQGKVVLASDVGGHRELIRHGETGRLFPAGDREALARALTELLAEQGAWAALGQAARRFVERERSWPASVARYQEVYGRALARGA
ncbi:MAG: glycosyltransferase, exosortase A system-associated [Gammaproteobacteria bacterium]|nr:MAG: glycosyltransferase, exosortase A system-associated [Gammaproteobacteria bacterium]